jgi:hypothetical protein
MAKKVPRISMPFYFKPKAYLLQASMLQASSSLQFGACLLADYMGGRVWLLDKKLRDLLPL